MLGPYALVATGPAQAQGLFVISAALAGLAAYARGAQPFLVAGWLTTIAFSDDGRLWSAGFWRPLAITRKRVADLNGGFQSRRRR